MTDRVHAIANGKGGVGKTTLAINLWAAVGSRDTDAVLLDADLRMADVAGMLDVETTGSLQDVLAGRATVEDVLIEYEEGLAILPGAAAVDAGGEIDPTRLEYALAALRHRFGVVLVDTGAGLRHTDATAFGLVDGTIVVTTPERRAREAAAKTIDVAERVGGSVDGVIVNRVREADDPLAIARALDADIIGAVPDSAGLDRRADRAIPIVDRDPRAKAAGAIQAIADWLADEVQTPPQTQGGVAREGASRPQRHRPEQPPTTDPTADQGADPAGGLRAWLAGVIR